MSSLSTAEEIEDEINFIDILITTLDVDADDYQADLRKHEQAKADLERRLATMQSNPGPSNHGKFGGDGAADQRASDAQWWQVAMNSRPASNYSSGSSTASANTFSMSGDSSGFGASGNKRVRPQSSYLDDQGSNKRLTPEPSHSALSSHASAQQRGLSERAHMQQRAAEAAIRRQAELQQADAAFARQLSQPNTSSSSATPSSIRPGIQTTLNHDGSYQRRPPQSLHSTSSHAPMNHIKAEPTSAGRPQQLAQRPRQPAAVVDLTGSDSEEDDLEEIAPTSFTPSRRPAPQMTNGYPNSNMRPLHTPMPTTMQQPNSMSMPGAYPGFQTFGGPSRGPGPVGAPNGAFNSAGPVYRSPFLTQAMNGIRSASATLGTQMQELNNLMNGSRARPLDLEDDDDDLVYGGSRRLGNYAGHEDLYNDRLNAMVHHDPLTNKADIEALLQNIRPDEQMPAHLRVTTPRDMNVQLHKYQELGLTWLKACEEGSNKGGILADDMGLGKTIQMLSLMVTRKSDDPLCKTTLIIAPVALMRQWKQEISNKIKPNRKLTVFIHHGQSKKKDFRDFMQYDVVLTTYGSIASELKKLEAFRRRQIQDPDAREYPKEKTVLINPNANWYRVVLDEAQCIKNRNTQTSKAACLLKAKYRFCVTVSERNRNVFETYDDHR